MFGLTKRCRCHHHDPELTEDSPVESLTDISRWLWQYRADPSQTVTSWPSEQERVQAAPRLRFSRWLRERGRLSS